MAAPGGRQIEPAVRAWATWWFTGVHEPLSLSENEGTEADQSIADDFAALRTQGLDADQGHDLVNLTLEFFAALAESA